METKKEKMKKEIISSIKYILFCLAVVLLILNISLVSSLDVYSGDTINITLDKPYSSYSNYSIVGNTTEINVTIVQIGEKEVNITFDKYTQDDSFEIVFLEKGEVQEPTVVYRSSGGGGTRTITKEVIKEVDNYISVPNNTIEYVENTGEEIVKEKESPIWKWMVVVLFLVIIILSYYLSHKHSSEIKESKELEGGKENE